MVPVAEVPSSTGVATNYFTCTLGEAAELGPNQSPKYATINSLIDGQNISNPKLPAVAFPVPGQDGTEWDYLIFSSFIRPIPLFDIK
jgi:hypothetical protein